MSCMSFKCGKPPRFARRLNTLEDTGKYHVLGAGTRASIAEYKMPDEYPALGCCCIGRGRGSGRHAAAFEALCNWYRSTELGLFRSPRRRQATKLKGWPHIGVSRLAPTVNESAIAIPIVIPGKTRHVTGYR